MQCKHSTSRYSIGGIYMLMIYAYARILHNLSIFAPKEGVAIVLRQHVHHGPHIIRARG